MSLKEMIMFKDTPAFSSFSVDDIDKAKKFYTDTLGLEVKEEHGGLSLMLAGDVQIMVYPKDDQHVAANYTVLNFRVDDIEKVVDGLIEKGVTFEQYDFMHTDAKGITPAGENSPRMAWFTDPAGNIFAVMQVTE